MTPTSINHDPEAFSGHPLARVLLDAYRAGRDGVITVVRRGEEARISITLRQGRVVSVAHETTTIEGVVATLVRVGILSEKDLARARRDAARREVYLEDYLTQCGLVSKGTISATREKAATELLMRLLLCGDLEVTAAWSSPRGVRESFTLPIPFLLKEAQRRASVAPAIRRAVPGLDAVFAKTSDLCRQEERPRWEDLKMSAAERQVYFFVDGRRTVADLMLSTAQSEFEVSQALHSLLEMRLIAPVHGAVSATTHVARSSTRRLAGLAAAVVALLGVIYLILAPEGDDRKSFSPRSRGLTFESLLHNAPLRRVEGAARIADLFGEVEVHSFEDLVRAGLALPEDRRAAVLLRLDRTPAAADPETTR